MRIDLFLKVSGLLKTRSIAGKAISSGAVFMNGRGVKPSAPVETGSVISLVRPDGEELTVRVLQVPSGTNVSRSERTSLYQIMKRGETGCS